MQNHIEEQENQYPGRPVNTSDAFQRVIAPTTSSSRFAESRDGMPHGPMAVSGLTSMQYPVQYPIGQLHSQPVPQSQTPLPHGTVQSQVLHQQQIHQAQAQAHVQSLFGSQVHAQSPAGQQQQQQFQRLKVEDALSYLDQVKLQFGNQPQVYNDFLDIMKEFKSQTIDTPGVISRVSNLFKGHPDLIVGFNTFLPPGYKIEVSGNDTICVQQPGQAAITISHGTILPQPPVSPQVSSVPLSHPAQSLHSYHQSTRPSQDVPPSPQHVGAQPPLASQPVEFNHAINYVNKIKNRFQGQPEIYKSFLEILHTYQKEQRNLKEGLIPPGYKPLTEAEVYSQVAKLFQNQEDLLSEFGQFLPDANGSGGGFNWFSKNADFGIRNDHSSTVKKPSFATKSTSKSGIRRQSAGSQQQSKKMKMSSLKDITLAEAGKYGTLNEYAFFDKVRKALHNQEVYENFLRCLVLFNQEVISRTELVQLVQPFLGKFPELFKWFKDFLGYKADGAHFESIAGGATGKERISGDLAMEIDYASCKRYGASYRGLPKSYTQPKCSGRTALCKEVLNDTWVSFPSWSEDSTFVTSRKTQYEENIYRCEDERFELDIVLETNLSTIKILETVQKKLQRMSSEEAAKFKLDNSLGGTSEMIQRKAIQRIYGDKAPDIIDGLKKNPVVAVPLVLRRLKAKEEEWREAQKGFNRIWRDQNEKYYLKSLDHQGNNFKQNDIKTLRSKSLLNEIEAILDERQEAVSEGDGANSDLNKPHMMFAYKDKQLLDDATSIIIHHVRRQAGIHKGDKHKVKQLMLHFIPDLLYMPRGELSDDEGDADDESDDNDQKTSRDDRKMERDKKRGNGLDGSPSQEVKDELTDQVMAEPVMTATTNNKTDMVNGIVESKVKKDEFENDDDVYTVFYINNNWYLFLRLHNILIERLQKVWQLSSQIAEEEKRCKAERKQSTAVALRLKAPSEVDPINYYSYFVEMIKGLLDGNVEASFYEDQMREMYGIHAYVTFTMDKVVQNIVRQLQHIVCDEIGCQVTQIFQDEKSNGVACGIMASIDQMMNAHMMYQKRVEQLLTDENCFKIVTFKKDLHLTVELLDTETENSDEAVEVEKWTEYVEKFTSLDDVIPDELKDQLARKPVFLLRNRNRHKYNENENDTDEASENNKETLALEGANNDTTQHNGDASPHDKDNDSQDLAKNMEIIENTECRFNVNSFKMVFVVNSESYLYKRNALTKARKSHRKVSLSMHEKFEKWTSEWRAQNISKEQIQENEAWLLGLGEGLKRCETVRKANSDLNKSPYYTYNRYHVTYFPEEAKEETMDM